MNPKQTAWWLGATGLIPFVGLATLAIVSPQYAELAMRALVAYGMVILSFLGAIHWGAVLKQSNSYDARRGIGALVWGVVPSLLAWSTGLLDATTQALWLAAGLVAALIVDMVAYPRYGFPAWMLPIRWVATIGASSSLVLASIFNRMA